VNINAVKSVLGIPLKVALIDLPGNIKTTLLTNSTGLAVLKGFSEASFPGIEVLLLNRQRFSRRDLVQQITEFKPDILGLSVKATCLPATHEVMNDLAKAENTAKKVVFGGATPTFAPEPMLKLYPNGIMVSQVDGEYPFKGIIEHVTYGTSLNNVPGISYFDQDSGQIIHTARKPFDLNDAPELDFTYFKKIANSGGEIWLESSRVCEHSCGFCVENASVRGFPRREFSDRFMEYQINMLVQHHIRQVHFTDSDFIGINYQRAKRIAKMFNKAKKNDKKIHWGIDTTVNAVVGAEDSIPNFWGYLKSSGLNRVYLGLESLDPTQRQRLGKDSSIEVALRAIAILRKKYIPFSCGTIVFDPWLTPQELENNLSALEEYQLFKNNIKPLRSLRLQLGTRLFEKAVHEGLAIDADLTDDLIFANYRYENSSIGKLAKIAAKWSSLISPIYSGIEVVSGLLNFKRGEFIPTAGETFKSSLQETLSEFTLSDIRWIRKLNQQIINQGKINGKIEDIFTQRKKELFYLLPDAQISARYDLSIIMTYMEDDEPYTAPAIFDIENFIYKFAQRHYPSSLRQFSTGGFFDLFPQ
jgi:hypothetical protein